MKRIISIILSLIFIVCTPTLGLAIEDQRVTNIQGGNDFILPKNSHLETDVSFPFFIADYNEIEVGNKQAKPSQEEIDYQTVTAKIGRDQLTLVLKGLTENNRDEIIFWVNEYIDQILTDKQHVKIYMPDSLDAEKYSADLYDSQLCWAATAANMLWSSGFAQLATNPFTSSRFKSTDEVFEYFRQSFFDKGGCPTDPIKWFFDGNYSFSQLNNTTFGGLLANESKTIKESFNDLTILDNLEEYSGGILVDFYNYSLNRFDDDKVANRHWVTIVGVIVDENATSIRDKYKAIILADSDNDKIQGSLGDNDKAGKAASWYNTYTVYPLSYDQYCQDGNQYNYYWTMNDFYGYDYPITWITTLKDKNVVKYSAITWLDDNGNIVDRTIVQNGTLPTHASLSKQATEEKTYVFSGWNPNPVIVTGPASYQASFSEITNSYTITWKNDDGTVIDTTSVEYGKLPTHADPIKAETADHKYVFAGWDPQVVPVTGNAEYKATFTESVKYYPYSGAGQNYSKGSNENKEFIVKRSIDDNLTFSLLSGIQVDGINLDNTNYDAVQGSVKITLKAAYLDTLSIGNHILTVLFADGKNDIPFSVSGAGVTATPTATITVTPSVTPTGNPINPANFDDVAVPSDSFTFKKVWQGDAEKAINFTLYKADGSVYHHGFDKKVVSNTEWRYNAYFSAPAACYVIEEPVPGYITKYVNVGVYADVTDRCCEGGTIINKKIPKTGDTADFALWAGIVLIGVIGLTTTVILLKRRKAYK